MKTVLAKYYPWIPLLVLGVFYTCRAVDFPVHDFANYYFGGQFLAESHFNSSIYFPYEFNQTILASGYSGIFASYAPNTPFLAVFFTPLSLVPIGMAKIFFNVFSLLLFVFSLHRLFTFYKLNPLFALLVPVLFLVPIKNSLLFGQVYFLLFFLLAEGWLAFEKQHWKTMGLFWGLAILLKVFPVVLIAFLLFRKQWKALFYLAISGVLLLGISILFTGMDVWLFYLKEVLPKASNGEIATAFVDNYQSVLMFLKRIFVYDTIENPHATFDADSWFTAIVFAFKIGILALGYFISRKTQKALSTFSYWILAMVLLSPYGSTYTFILLLFPFLALLKSGISNAKKVVFSILLFVINNLPLSFFIENHFPFSYWRLFALIAFAVLFIVFLFQKSALLPALVLGCVVFFIGTFFNTAKPQYGNLLLDAQSPILIYDYEIKNNELIYSYWNEKGENKASIPFQSSIIEKLDSKENQFFASDKSKPLKPLLIDNKILLYLSDYGRGIGFYTIRKINLK